MATINASTGADIIVPSNNGTTYRGLEGNDTYILSNAIAANASVTIVDTSGTNTIQLVDGLSIASSKFAADSAQLTLSNGAVVTINNADQFTFEVGGNETAGVTGSSNTYAELASAMGVDPLPTGSTISDGSGGTITGSSVSGSSASSYSLSADATSVAEGGSITYTVTANAAVSSDTALTYNVRGSDNSGSVDKASGSDVDSQSGTVTILSGNSSATFTITATADNLAEGLEGIDVSVFDGNLNVIGTKTALISNNADLETTATNLTTANDAVTGGGGKDTIGAQIGTDGSTTATTFTYNPGDTIDGGAGSDTVKISKSGTNTGAQTYTGVEISNVENFEVSNFDAGVGARSDTFDFTLITGVTTAGLTSSSTTDVAGDTVFSNVAVLFDEVILKSGGAGLTVTYNAATVAGPGHSQNVLLSGTTANADLTLAGIETINITGGAIKSTLAALTTAAATSINFDGDTSVTITAALEGGATTVNASANTAGVSVQLNPDAATGTTFTGSAAADTVTMADDALTQLTSINGGDGNDTIAFSDAADITILTGPMVSGFETLRATAIEASEDYDVSLISGITGLQAAAADNAGGDVMFKNASGSETARVMGTDGIGVTLAVDGAADAITVTYASALGGGLSVGSNGGTSLAQYETINIISGGSTASNTGALTIGSAGSITVTGAASLTLGASSSTVLTSIDASGMTGIAALSMGTNAGTALFPQTIIGSPGGADTLIGADGADTITGLGGNDIINGAESTDTIIGGAGNDNITGDLGSDILSGGAGNDTFTVDNDTDFITLATPEVVDGGDGTDTLTFTEDASLTIANTDLHNISNVEVIKFEGDAAVSITLDDAFFTSNGATSIILNDSENTAALTVAAGTVTAANSLDVRLNSNTGVNDNITGGAGDDIFKISTLGNAAALDANDIITGGKGTDTLAITVATNNLTSATMSGVTAVEKITFTALNTETAGFVLANATFVTTATAVVTGVVDASSWTGTGALTFDGSAEADSKMEITGGNGGDILTGGAKADTIIGGLGADTIIGGDGIDIIDGGAGNDIITVDDVSDFIGLTSAETVIGGSGAADVLNFSENATTTIAASDLMKISGIETIKLGGTGANTITLNNDVFAANGSTTLTITDSATAGASTVAAGGLSAANSIKYTNTAASSTTDTVTGGAGDDTYTTFEDSLVAADVFAGGAGTDTFNIKLDGGNLADLTLGSTNIEVINVTTDSSARTAAFTLADTNFASVAGVINAATMTGGLTLDADAENDSSLTITTGVGADSIIGTDTAATGDTISTGTGDDTIEGSKGGDTITGGAGADDFVLKAVADSSGTTPDTYTDFVSGTDEFNVTATFASNNSGVTINADVLTGVASKAAAQESLTGQRMEVIYDTGTGQAYINMNQDNLITSLDYTLKINVGATPKSTLQSKDFNFTITGSESGDTIVSGAGDDNLTGGAGNDAINAGLGINIIATGAGNDQVTNTETGVDTITLTSGSDDVAYSSVGDVASSNVTLTSATAPDFIATAGTTVDSILSFNSTADEIDILGALNAAIDADGAISDTAALVANGGNLDYDAGGVFIMGGTNDNAADDLAGDNFGDVSDVLTIFNAANGTPANAAANDEILFAVENNANTQWGLYYLKDVDGDGDISTGDQLALIAILTTNALVVADFNFV
jgi:Ca2+-binding RTX toxin-like protein